MYMKRDKLKCQNDNCSLGMKKFANKQAPTFNVLEEFLSSVSILLDCCCCCCCCCIGDGDGDGDDDGDKCCC